MVISDYTGLPWKTMEFRRHWRKVARAAGVPNEVRNMDSAKVGEKDSTEPDEVPPEDAINLDEELIGATPH